MLDKSLIEFLDSPEFDEDRFVVDLPAFQSRLMKACRDNPELPPFCG